MVKQLEHDPVLPGSSRQPLFFDLTNQKSIPPELQALFIADLGRVEHIDPRPLLKVFDAVRAQVAQQKPEEK